VKNKVKVGIIGGAGYTGGELLRILIFHPMVDIVFIHSNSNAGNLISDVHTDLLGDTDLKFSDSHHSNVDVLFLCVGHGDSKKFFEANPKYLAHETLKIVDLSQDFRPESNGFVYGLPELKKLKIKSAQRIANPGCFATAIQLSLLPLASQSLLKQEIHISATTGSTGAGQSLAATSHFTWRNNNLSVYKAFEHQHLKEITQSIIQLEPGFSQTINFVPYRGGFTRGIMASVYTKTDLSLEAALELYKNYYQEHPFTHVSDKNIDLKQVVNTNKCILYLEKHGDNLMILSIIDNLTKGASGQAVQNMNLLFGLEETSGLKLKPVGF
jgi:N-acetyl-gamma-glutamyl-phosphate reductase